MTCIRNPFQQRPIRQDGQSLVEFALVLAFVIIPFTFVLIETSLLLYKYVALTNAAREGARAASIYLYVGNPGGSFTAPDAGRSTAAAATVQGMVAPLIVPPPDCSNTAATTVCQISYGPSGSPAPMINYLRSTDVMTLTITHTHSFLFGALGTSIDLHAQAAMRIEPSTVISGP